MPAAGAARASEPQAEARPAATARAGRRGVPTGEGTALALLRANPTAVLRAGPQFPGSGGRSGARGRRPNPATALAAAAAVGRTADEVVEGGARSSFRQSFRLGRSASLGEQRHRRSGTTVRRSASLDDAGAPGAVGSPRPYARVTELVQALQRGYLELEGVDTVAAAASRRRR